MSLDSNKGLRKKKEERNGISKRTQQDLNPIPDMIDVYKDKFNIQKIDYYAFMFSGISFLIFNIVYWITFLVFNNPPQSIGLNYTYFDHY